MTGINPTLLVITLNVKGLNIAIKERLVEWINCPDPTIFCSQKTHFLLKDTNRLKRKGQKKIYHVNSNQKRAGVTILISDKIDFKIKIVTRCKEVHVIMLRGSIHQEDTTIIRLYARNNRDSNYMKQNLMRVEGRNIQFNSNSWRFQHQTFNN